MDPTPKPSCASAVSVDSQNQPLCDGEVPRKARRPRRLRIPTSHISLHYTAEPSPVTPCSVFSFDIPNSPAVLSVRPRFSRQSSSHNDPSLSPRSMFTFDLPFEIGSQRSLRSHPTSTPNTPTPCSPALKTPLFSHLPTIEESRASFSFAASSIRDVEEEKDTKASWSEGEDKSALMEEEQKTDWKSIRLVMFVILFTRIQFTVYFASLWPFLQEVDENATNEDYAFISAAYSIGIAGSATVFGLWSNKLGCIRIPSITSMVLMLITNLMYMFLHIVPGYGRFGMGVARFIAGIAAGGNALLPTYWTYAAAPADRSTAAALYDGAFCLGIAIGPGFQLLFSPLGYPGYNIFGLQLNMYTIPALTGFILITISMYLMIFHFDEVPMPKKEINKRGSIDSSSSNSSSGMYLPPYDRLAVFLCIFAKMIQMFIYASMETIGSMYTQRMFNLTRTETTQYNSILVGLSGLVGFFFLLTYVWSKIGKRIDNRSGAMAGVCICLGFIITTYSWPAYSNVVGTNIPDCDWCSTTTRIPQWLYSLAYIVVFGMGFALINVHVAALYSSVLGPRRQGTMHGLNTLMASCSRVGGPIAVTDMFTTIGPRAVWIFQFFTWSILLVAFGTFYKRLVPCVPVERQPLPDNEGNIDKDED